MIVLAFLLLLVIIWIIDKCNDFAENALGRIWSHKQVNKNTVYRLRELYGNLDLSDAAALTMATRETHEDEGVVLDYFGADDATQLAEIFGRRKMSMGTRLVKIFCKSGRAKR